MDSRWRLGCVCCFILVAALLEAATAVDYELQWIVPSSADYYTNWTSNKTFEVGDAVIFNWTGTHNVEYVVKPDYDNCTKRNSVPDGTNNKKFYPTSSGNHYFICTVDNHCERGQKVAITFKDRVNETSYAPSVTVGVLYTAITISVMYFLSYYYV